MHYYFLLISNISLSSDWQIWNRWSEYCHFVPSCVCDLLCRWKCLQWVFYDGV